MGTLLYILIIALLLVCSALFSGLTIGILSLNHFELKRKAQLGNKAAKLVFPIRALGHQLTVTLLIGNIIVNAAITAMFNMKMNGLYAVLLTTVFVVIFGEILPMAYLRKYGLEVSAKLSKALKYLILVLSPIAKPLGKLLDKLLGGDTPTVYSKEELYKIFEDHEVSEYSDIEADEVQIVRHALSFGDKLVRNVMTPRRMVVSVASDEVLGPIVVDELHKSGFSRFPVYNDKQTQNYIGTLYLRDLVSLKEEKTAKELMRKDVNYIHEEQKLDYALNVFLKTDHHLLIVVNTFEEFVGVISLEDVIEQIIGKQIMDEDDIHADLRAVAKSLADRESKARKLS